MRIAHLTFGYYPDPVGGTEVYVRALAQEQKHIGHHVVIVAPGNQYAHYEHEGFAVYRYGVKNNVDNVAELYRATESVSVQDFEQMLDAVRPDVLHVHGYTAAVTRELLSSARQRGARIVFTYHTPTATCVRGTLLRWGTDVCDGFLDAKVCTACMLQAGGLTRPVATLVARAPAVPSKLLPNSRIGTALRMGELVALRHEEIRSFLSGVDRIVATSQWVFELLLRNGVAPGRVTLSRQGTCLNAIRDLQPVSQGSLRLAFFGRIERIKGLHVVMSALQRIRNADLALDVYGIATADDAYTRAVRSQARSDSRIRMHEAIPRSRVLETMRAHDAVVVPSQWLETGPLVVLEAQAAGLPVLGSNLGGIRELVRDGVDGMLIERDDVHAWAEAIEKLCADRAMLAKLAAGVALPRSMKTVAGEMDAVYAQAVSSDAK